MTRFLARQWPIFLVLCVTAVGVAISSTLPVIRVGDGSEYYAMMLAWRDTLRPFMTAAAWQSYVALYGSKEIAYLVPPDVLRAAFPSLVSGATSDFNHFWFYSLIPGLLGALLPKNGSVLPQTLFLCLHWLLVAGPFVVAWRYFGGRGLAAVAMLLFLSPAVWYINKVHAELFTVCVVLASVIFFRANRFPASALMLAVASTQNISFLAVSLFVVVLDARRRWGRDHYRLRDVAILVATIVTLMLHPLYFFFRLGTITPQILAGGAEIGINPRTFYLWFFDPDLGLFPNWPLVLGLIGFSWFRIKSTSPSMVTGNGSRYSFAWIGFLLVYLTVNLVAQSSTQNLNSAATPGLARYSLWYIPLFFPICLSAADILVVRRPSGGGPASERVFPGVRTGPSWFRQAALILVLLGGAAYACVFFQPTLTEAGAYEPSWSSMAVQRYLPGLYDPPVEVFMERYGTIGEDNALNSARAIVGPDCRKLLIRGPEHHVILGGAKCLYSPLKLLHSLTALHVPGPISYPAYVHLDETLAAQSRYTVESEDWIPIVPGSESSAVLTAGWGQPEAWGVWSSSDRAELRIPCSRSATTTPWQIEMALRAFVVPGHTMVRATPSLDGKEFPALVFQFPDKAENTLTLPITNSNCVDGSVRVVLDIRDPASPASLKISEDGRILGIGLARFRIFKGS